MQPWISDRLTEYSNEECWKLKNEDASLESSTWITYTSCNDHQCACCVSVALQKSYYTARETTYSGRQSTD